MSQQNREGYQHLGMVLLVVFLMVLGCAGVAVGMVLLPYWVDHHMMVTK